MENCHGTYQVFLNGSILVSTLMPFLTHMAPRLRLFLVTATGQKLKIGVDGASISMPYNSENFSSNGQPSETLDGVFQIDLAADLVWYPQVDLSQSKFSSLLLKDFEGNGSSQQLSNVIEINYSGETIDLKINEAEISFLVIFLQS